MVKNNCCIVSTLKLQDHPNDTNLQIGVILGHNVVVGRHYDEGVIGFHIPCGCVVPDKLLEEMWLKGKLSGSKKNKVKTREMKGIVSDGLFYASRYFVFKDGVKTYIESPSWNSNWQEGHDVSDELGIS
jgi:hypothetical protein